jgi:hypothetical protein
MFPEFIQFILQFGDRLFEIELMLHAVGILTFLRPVATRNYTFKKLKGPDLRPAP